MDCGYKEKVILCFYGELPEADAAGVKRHADSCASCAGDLAVLKGLAARFDSFSPEPPRLGAAELAEAAREPGFRGAVLVYLRGAAVAAACTAVFLLAFRLLGPGRGARPAVSAAERAAWNSEIDSGLDNVEYGIYDLEDDMLYSSSADFDFRWAGLETQKREIAEKAT